MEKLRSLSLLEQYKERPLGNGEMVYGFASGSQVEIVMPTLYPLLLPMWGSALSRPITDPLVVEDARVHPVKPTSRMKMVVDREGVGAVYLYKEKEYQGLVGLGIGICLVHERLQGRGVMRELISRSIGEMVPDFFILHTQNVNMAETVRNFAPQGCLFPFDGVTCDMGQMASSFCHHPEKFDTERMIERGFYCGGNPLYGDKRERSGRHEDINNFFRTHVNFQGGDSVLIIGLIPK